MEDQIFNKSSCNVWYLFFIFFITEQAFLQLKPRKAFVNIFEKIYQNYQNILYIFSPHIYKKKRHHYVLALYSICMSGRITSCWICIRVSQNNTFSYFQKAHFFWKYWKLSQQWAKKTLKTGKYWKSVQKHGIFLPVGSIFNIFKNKFHRRAQ